VCQHETDGCRYGRGAERRQSVRLCKVQDGFTQEAACSRFKLPWPAGSWIGRYCMAPLLLSCIDIVNVYWTAAHHRICRTIASQSPVLTLRGICVPPTVNCLQYLVAGSTLTAIGLFRLPAPQSGTLSRISSGTRPSVWTVSDGCLKCTCSLDTSAFSALEVLTTTALYKFTYLLTYLLQLSVYSAVQQMWWLLHVSVSSFPHMSVTLSSRQVV